jgi:hypothetical protein
MMTSQQQGMWEETMPEARNRLLPLYQSRDALASASGSPLVWAAVFCQQ